MFSVKLSALVMLFTFDGNDFLLLKTILLRVMPFLLTLLLENATATSKQKQGNIQSETVGDISALLIDFPKPLNQLL